MTVLNASITQLQDYFIASQTISGGGTVYIDTVHRTLRWDGVIRITPKYRLGIDAGYYDLPMPPVGTQIPLITGSPLPPFTEPYVAAVSASGLRINGSHMLFYAPDPAGVYNPLNFRVVTLGVGLDLSLIHI